MNRLRGTALAVLAGMCFPVAADNALLRETEFRIERGPLSNALIQFSTQSGIQVVAADATTSAAASPEVRGRLSAAEALRQLLSLTALRYRLVGEDTIALIAEDAAAVRSRERATGPRELARPDPEPALTLQEVMVTAEKRLRTLQETPVSMSVLDAGQLQRRGITGLTGLFTGATPSLRVSTTIGRTSALTIAMRGIHSGDVSQISRDAGVGIYLDGIYLGRNHGLSAELLDVQRIEVLRGPQGTLFGRNALGGAVNVVSRRPSGRLSLSQSLGVYSHGGLRAGTFLDLPEIAGISVKVDAATHQRDGLVVNPLPGATDYGQFRRRGLRMQAAWRPDPRFEAVYALDLSSDESAPHYLHLTGLTGEQGDLAPMFSLEPRRVRHARAPVPLEPSKGRITGHNLSLSWQATDGLELRSITGWRSVNQSQFDNWAGASEAFIPGRMFARASNAHLWQSQFSHELQLLHSGRRLDWIAGAYQFHEWARDHAQEFYTNQFNEAGTAAWVVRHDATGVPMARASRNQSRSLALFGEASWRFELGGEHLKATAGGRFTHDDKQGSLTVRNGAPAPPDSRYEFESRRVDPSASLAWQWSPERNFYLRWSTAYRAGGANSRSASFRPFDPEEVRSWEAGIKFGFSSSRARLNLAVYDMSYRQLQVNFFMPDNPVITETVNTDRPAAIRGVEADFALAVTSRLRVAGTYAVSDVHIPPQVDPFTGGEIRLAPVYAPRHAATAEVEYQAGRAGGAPLVLYADASYASGQYTYNADTQRSQPALLMNARLTVQDIPLGGGRLAVSLWGRNLLDRDHELAGIDGVVGSMVVFGEPRSIGLDATLRFGRND